LVLARNAEIARVLCLLDPVAGAGLARTPPPAFPFLQIQLSKSHRDDTPSSRPLRDDFRERYPFRWCRFGTAHLERRAMPVEGGEALSASRQEPDKQQSPPGVNTSVKKT